MIFTICNCKIVKLNKMHMLLIATTVIDILLSMKKYMSRSKQIIYLCNIHFIPMSYYQSLNISHKNLMTCTLIVRLHKYIICFDLDMYFLIDSNMSTIVITINKYMHLVMFYYFAVINCKYHNLLKSYIYLKLTAF